MKTVRKAILAILCIAALVVASVMGTLAYLTDTEEAVNTFTVGNVQIDLNETDVDNNNNTKANAYHLLPGQTYTKDPTVTVEANSEESYIRMIVTVSNIASLKEAFPVSPTDNRYTDWYDAGGNFLLQKLVSGWDSSKWECVSINGNVYEFRYTSTVSTKDAEAKKLEPLFEKIVVPGTVNNTELAKLNEMEINVTAHAIQAAGFGTADAAWTAFNTQHP